MKKEVTYLDVIEEANKGLIDGRVIICSGKEKPNPMAIGWGTIGVLWNKPVFIVFIRPSRYTFNLIETIGDFTVNVFSEKYKSIVNYCGNVSGRNIDKFKETKLTPLKSKKINSPIIKESLISFECKVIGKFDILPQMISEDIIKEIYPRNDFHRGYIGEILAVYTDQS